MWVSYTLKQLRHKHTPLLQSGSLQRNCHQDLTPPMQCTRCRQKKPTTTVAFRYKYWLTLIAYYHSAGFGTSKINSFWWQWSQDLCSTCMLKYTQAANAGKQKGHFVIWTDLKPRMVRSSGAAEIKSQISKRGLQDLQNRLLWSIELLLFHWNSNTDTTSEKLNILPRNQTV